VFVCFLLQECAEKTFVTDFGFMAELGYTERELFRKGRFRPATFWRPGRVVLAAPPAHRDRILVTSFAPVAMGPTAPAVYVLNCHLSAGPEGPRRFRQMLDALDFVRKDLTKQADAVHKAAAAVAKAAKAAAKQTAANAQHATQPAAAAAGEMPLPAVDALAPLTSAEALAAAWSPATPAAPSAATCVIVIGDMNAEAARPSGVAVLLAHGVCTPALLEDGVPVTLKAKTQALARFVDPYELAFTAAPPPTMVCEHLIPRLLAPGEDEHGAPHPHLLVALRKVFDAFAGTHGGVLRGAPLAVRTLHSPTEFWSDVVPLRHRVLWPDGPLVGALVPGDPERSSSSSAAANTSPSVDDGSAVHLGLFEGFADSLVGVLSLYSDAHPAGRDDDDDDMATPREAGSRTAISKPKKALRLRLRKFAVEPWAQGRGYGSKLLEHAKGAAAAMAVASEAVAGGNADDVGPAVLWCDARAEQASFYEKRGFVQSGEVFDKKGRPYVVMECPIPLVEVAVAQGSAAANLLLGNKPAAVGTVVGTADVRVMRKAAVLRWLETINFQVGRGTEFRAAAAFMGWLPPELPTSTTGEAEDQDPRPPRPKAASDLPDAGALSWREFRHIYETEVCIILTLIKVIHLPNVSFQSLFLSSTVKFSVGALLLFFSWQVRGGKYWGVAWDLSKCGSPLPGANEGERFVARYDRVWVGEAGAAAAATTSVLPTGRVRVVAVRATLATGAAPPPLLPNAQHPSDHLPIGLTVEFAVR
jgi:GNAT superfamily N-acetyltransferase/endonuclease/exonuclease/phosphatase family metal-dependent hydrolase